MQHARTAIASLRRVACALVASAPFLVAAEPVTLTAADGVAVHGEVWRGAGEGGRRPWIVAFHQAESSSAEYAPIAPRLVAAGFDVLAIDQRSGDGAFGGTNRTVAALGRSSDYDDALPDMAAALAWARQKAGAPVVVWGSSYSAALVFVLAAQHAADVQGVVAFSPDEYLKRKGAVREAARRVTVPVYIDQASKSDERSAGARLLKAVASADKSQYRGKARSPHGSSALRPDSNAAGAEAHWQGVLAFLRRFVG